MRRALTVLLTAVVFCVPATAQEPDFPLFNLGDTFGAKPQSARPTATARLVSTELPTVVAVQIQVVIPSGANTYSQNPTFDKPTTFSLNVPAGWTAIDADFTPDHPPKVGYDEFFEKEVEKFTGAIVFTRRFQIPDGADASTAALEGAVDLLVCDAANCQPHQLSFRTAYAEVGFVPVDAAAPPAVATDIPAPAARPEPGPLAWGYALVPTRGTSENRRADPVQLQVELAPAHAQPGELVTFALTMTLDENWTTYALEPADETQLELPTELNLTPENLEPVGEMLADPPAQLHEVEIDEIHRSLFHAGRVTWRQQYRVLQTGDYGVSGEITYQICEKKTRCLSPHRVAFSLGSGQQADHLVGAAAISDSYAAISGAGAAGEPSFSVTIEGADWTLTEAFVRGFLVGLLMNVLPCVLPVLAIKILSFVQQAGESHLRIFALNLSYTFGVMAVFLAFAVLSWGLGNSLGSIFQNAGFNIVMACIVFVMGLSLFGVFELPVPGVIPSAGDHQEGYVGAFNTGIIATLLGTPCIGPFVAPIFTWSLTQPAPLVFAVFGMMGIGMAFPFLLTGIFPWMVNWLPRPGMWMVRFKQFTGFVLMGTVIFLLFAIDMAWRIPVLVILLSLGLFVWMTANLASPADSTKKIWTVRALSLAASLPVFLTGLWMIREFKEVGAGAFVAAGAPEEAAEVDGQDAVHRMPWQPFSGEKLTALRTAGKPVFIDFTANWCVICKINEKIAIDRQETVAFIREHGFTPMMADFTKQNPEILEWLKRFGQDSVPLTIIIPPGADSTIIALRGQYTQEMLLSKLREAVGQSAPAVANEGTRDRVGLKH